MMGETTHTNPPSPAVFHDFLAAQAPSPSFLEKQVGSQLERMSSYGPKSELSMSEVSNRFVGSKRRHSDSTFTGTSREGVPQMIPETSQMLCSSSGGERVKMPPFDRPLHGIPHQIMPVSSFTSQTLAETNNANFVNSERLIPMNVGGSSMQDNALVMKSSPHVYQVPSSRFRDIISGPSAISHLAADEGSRTGNKGSGILSSINAHSNPLFKRNPSGLVSSGCKLKLATHNLNLESSNPRSSQGLVTSSKQMTIIYGGRVHVFDDVYPNKADVIMSLAGSNGGCWSTSLPKSSARMTMNNSLPGGGNIAKYAGMSGQPSESSLERNWEI